MEEKRGGRRSGGVGLMCFPSKQRSGTAFWQWEGSGGTDRQAVAGDGTVQWESLFEWLHGGLR